MDESGDGYEESPRAGPSPASIEAPPLPARPKGKKKGSFFKELPVLILIAFGLAMLVKTFLVQAFYIPSGSMLPTLELQDRVLVNKLVYRFREPRRGEIIVFIGEHDTRERSLLQKIRDQITEGFGGTTSAERDFIKRVIGLPGETVEVEEDGTVFVTPVGGKRFEMAEPYIAPHEDPEPFGPLVVPPDSYFVMGDNREESADSRSSLGPIAKDEIVGKAFVRIWPPGRFDFFRRPKYEGAPGARPASPAPAVLAFGLVGGLRRRS